MPALWRGDAARQVHESVVVLLPALSAATPVDSAMTDIDRRVERLLSELSLEAKAALMFHTMAVIGDAGDWAGELPIPSVHTLLDAGLTHFNLLGPAPSGREFAQWVNMIQRIAVARPAGVPVTFSSDPRHHFTDNPMAQMMSGAYSQWPETLGLAALASVPRVRQFADIARQEYLATGIRVALHPQIDLATEPRWSRINGTFGEDAELTSALAVAYVQGLQTDSLGADSVAAMVKHFPVADRSWTAGTPTSRGVGSRCTRAATAITTCGRSSTCWPQGLPR